MKNLWAPIVAALLSASATAGGISTQRPTPNNPVADSINGSYMENKGQWDPSVLFYGQSTGVRMWAQKTALTIDVYKDEVIPNVNWSGGNDPLKYRNRTGQVIQLDFLGASGKATGIGTGPDDLHIDFVGMRGRNNAKGVKQYQEALVDNLYPGVDMRLYRDSVGPRYDLIVAPGADPSKIQFVPRGANGVSVSKTGDLVLNTIVGPVEMKGLFAYQNVGGQRSQVQVQFRVSDKGTVSFALGNYDHSRPLVIDPLVYGTNFGGDAGYDEVMGTSTDGSSNLYMVGNTTSTDLPITAGPYGTEFLTDLQPEDQDAFLCTLQGDAYNVIYMCYIGGPGTDSAEAIQIDQYGNAWIGGDTTTLKFLEGGEWNVEEVPATLVSPQRDVTGGQFRFQYRGVQTDNIEWNATAQDVEDALNALPANLLPPGGFTCAGGPLPDATLNIQANQPVFPLRIVQKTREYFIDGNNAPDDSDLQGIFYNDDPNDYGWEPNTGTFRLRLDTTNVTDPLPWDVDGATVIAELSTLQPLSTNPPRVIPAGPQGPLFGDPIILQFMTGPPTSVPEPRPLMTIDEWLVDGGFLRFQPVPNTAFITKFAPSTTDVLDPFTDQVIKTFEGAEDFTSMSIRPVNGNTGTVEIALAGNRAPGSSMPDITGTPPTGSGFTPSHGFLLYMRYTQGTTTLSVQSARSTYIGGRANADVSSVVMDADGAIYVAGNVWLHDPLDTDPLPPDINTNATLGPTSNVFYTSGSVYTNGNLLRKTDAYVRKYNTNGSYAYSAVFGGSDDDFLGDMAVDLSGNVYLTGDSGSFNFPRTPGAYDQSSVPGEPFVSKINANATSVLYSTGINANSAFPRDISVDARGNAYIGGFARTLGNTPGIPFTPNAPNVIGQEAALDTNATSWTPTSPDWDAFLTVVNNTAVGLLYSSYAGWNNSMEYTNDIQTDRNGSVWVCGFSGAWAILGPYGLTPNYLTPLAFKPYGDGSDGWLFKMRIGLPVLDTITVTPNQIAGGLGSTANVNVTLKAPAPPGGSTITLRIMDPTYARFNTPTGPSLIRVTIPAGSQTMTVPAVVATRIVTAPTSTEIRAELDGDFIQDRLIIRPWLDSFLLGTSQATGGDIVDATVIIFQPAPAGGLTVNLSADSDRIVFPAGNQVTIPAGQTTVNFPINTLPVSAITDTVLTATVANVSLNATLQLVPPVINNLVVNPNRVSGGEPSAATVFLNGPTRVDTVVSLSQIGAPVTIPATVTVPAGQSQASFNIATTRVASNTSVRIRGSLNAFTLEDTLFLDATDIASVQLSSYNVLGGSLVDGRVNLTRPAGPTGLNIPMITNNPTAGTIIPVTVVVAPGATFGTFQVQTNVVPATQTMRVVTNKAGGFNNTGVTLTVRGLSVSLVMNPTSVVGGIQNSIGTITLNNNEIAPTGGIKVNLLSNVPAALSVPAFVTIPAGSRSVTFTASSSATSFDRNVVITALLSPGNSVSATVRVLAPRVSTLTISPIAVTGGQSATGTVRVDAPAPTGGLTIGLTSNTASATVPVSVTIPAGQTQATFTINTLPVAVKVNATIRAIGFSTSQSAILQIYPPSVSSFTFNPPSVPGGSSSTGTIRINLPAPVGGLRIDLTNNNPLFVSHPTFVTVPAGQTQVSFTANTNIATRVIAVTVTAKIADRGPVNGYLTITGTP